MQKLYQKHELWFALGWIAFYVVAVSFADELSRTIGIEKIVTLPLLLAMCAVLLIWICNGWIRWPKRFNHWKFRTEMVLSGLPVKTALWPSCANK